MQPLIIDFDDIDDWAPRLSAALTRLVPQSLAAQLREAAPGYIEDARDLLFQLTDRDSVIDATLGWMRAARIAAYHGSRLTDQEIASIRAGGLLPLKAEARRNRLLRALSCHPRWQEVAGGLDAAIEAYGRGEKGGRRENQVHLTLSRAGLIKCFNHYLTHGAEFDQCVAYALLGAEGKELLAKDGAQAVIRLAVPGSSALEGAHRYFSIDDLRRTGTVPHIAHEFLKAWSYKLAYPEFQSRELEIDCGMVFRNTVPSAWIVHFET